MPNVLHSSDLARDASCRDPDGFVFTFDGVVLRQVNASYQHTFGQLAESGFFATAWKEGLLIPHRDIARPPGPGGYTVIEPTQLTNITYPYEWAFSQLKDAALLTLNLQRLAMEHGFSLKDASAYNVQFHEGRPLFIDTLSFEDYVEGRPWPAYRQFCQHFLAPLALMAKVDARLGLLCRNHIDGVPLDLASRLLPKSTRFNLGLLTHIHLHAKAQKRYVNQQRKVAPRKISRQGVIGILSHLESTIKGLKWTPAGTEWGDYYAITNYADAARDEKRRLVDHLIGGSGAKSVWDLGANDGTYSRLAVARGLPVVAWDIDPVAVEKNYRQVRAQNEKLITPALVDLANPSPALGWNLRERMSLLERPRPDLALALALIHHLVIGNNVPLPQCADFFAQVAPQLIIEWVPKQDSKVQELLQNRVDIFPDYTDAGFEAGFGTRFDIVAKHPIAGSERVLYHLRRR
jgi:hypothetical protein